MPYYRRNVFVLSTTVFLASLSWNQVMPFLAFFLRDLGAPKAELPYWIGFAFAAHSLAAMLVQPFWGKLGDRYGQKPMVVRAGACLTGIYFGMSFCKRPWQLVIFRLLNGALTGFIPSSFALIATNTPQELAPRSVATAQTASAAGQIVGPALGGLLAALVGYRGSMRVAGTAVLISTFLVWRLVSAPNKAHETEGTSLVQDIAASARSPVLSAIMLTIMLQTAFFVAISSVLALHLAAMNSGVPTWLTGVVFALPAVAFVLSARSWAGLGERWGFEKVICTAFVGGAVCGAGLTVAHNVWLFGALFLAAGFFLAAVPPALASIISNRVDESFHGRAYGLQFSSAMIGAFLAPPAATCIGSVLGIPAVFVFAGAVLLAGLAVFRSLANRWEQT